jgi:hypothetical protein
MSNRNTPLIATLVAVVLCGLPGLFGLCFGATTLLAGFTPGAQIDIFGSNDQASATTLGTLVLCLSLILIAMPGVVWLVAGDLPHLLLLVTNRFRLPVKVLIEPSTIGYTKTAAPRRRRRCLSYAC